MHNFIFSYVATAVELIRSQTEVQQAAKFLIVVNMKKPKKIPDNKLLKMVIF